MPDAGDYLFWRRRNSAGKPILKNIEVTHDAGLSYHITVLDAKRLTGSGQARWTGPKTIKLKPSVSKRGLWAVVSRAAMYSEGVALGPKFGTLQLT